MAGELLPVQRRQRGRGLLFPSFHEDVSVWLLKNEQETIKYSISNCGFISDLETLFSMLKPTLEKRQYTRYNAFLLSAWTCGGAYGN